VAANSRPPVLLATGNEGSRVISWIRGGNYVFELYGDAERRTVLATVTVSGIATDLETSSQGTELSHSQLGWLLFAALYLSSTGPVRTKFPLEPATSLHPLHVVRNLLLGLATFICVDGVVFHTSLYTSILAPDSYAGRMAAITRAERDRVSSGLKEVLVLGDSRMAEGFSPAVADKLSSLDGFKFVNLTEPASAVNIWDYMLREVDPTRRHQRQPGEAVAIGDTRFPKNAVGRDPANAESLFGQFDRDRPYARTSRSICRAPGSFHDISRCFSHHYDSEGRFFTSRTNVRFS
jgi:hypothetical protein